jgi:hypothetical protein
LFCGNLCLERGGREEMSNLWFYFFYHLSFHFV